MSLIECWLIALIAVRARLGVYFSRSPGGWGKACEFGFCQWRRIKPVRGIDSSTSGYCFFFCVFRYPQWYSARYIMWQETVSIASKTMRCSHSASYNTK